jgi:predicted transcriptional regulator
MTEQVDGQRVREVLAKRGDALAALASARRDKPELVDSLDVSRSTVDRAVADLEETGLVRRVDGEFGATQAGELALESYREYTGATDSLGDALPLLDSLPDDAPMGTELLERASITLAEPHAPEAALSEVASRLPDAETLRGFAPVVKTNYVSMLHELVDSGDLSVEIIVESGTLDSLRSVATAHDEVAAFLESDTVAVFETEESLPYALWLLEAPSFQRAGVTVHENGAIVGVLTNDRPPAFERCRDEYDRILAEATRLDTAGED